MAREKPGIVVCSLLDVADLETVPLTADRWDDLETLFGSNGAYAGCWCMWFRHTTSAFEAAGAAGRRRELAELVAEDNQPGLLAYRKGEPVGWVAVGPRGEYDRLTSPRARVYQAFDDTPSWVITCFFVAKPDRGQGVASALLDAAVRYAAEHGATVVEGYPVELDGPRGDVHLYHGTMDMYARRGFVEVARFYGRPLVRLDLGAR